MNESDVVLKAIELGKADVGAGGLVELTENKPQPVITWGERNLFDPPFVAVLDFTTDETGETPRTSDGFLQFDVAVPAGADYGLEDQILDRLYAILTTPAMLGGAAPNVDCRIRFRNRRRLDPLEEGLRRKSVDGIVTFRN